MKDLKRVDYYSFNTVNGKYCCNKKQKLTTSNVNCFNTVNGKYCCNVGDNGETEAINTEFQYRKR